ncbi:MAG: hypothetical protein ACP5J4_06620 [Anaerolineae bacterium]
MLIRFHVCESLRQAALNRWSEVRREAVLLCLAEMDDDGAA